MIVSSLYSASGKYIQGQTFHQHLNCSEMYIRNTNYSNTHGFSFFFLFTAVIQWLEVLGGLFIHLLKGIINLIQWINDLVNAISFELEFICSISQMPRNVFMFGIVIELIGKSRCTIYVSIASNKLRKVVSGKNDIRRVQH